MSHKAYQFVGLDVKWKSFRDKERKLGIVFSHLMEEHSIPGNCLPALCCAIFQEVLERVDASRRNVWVL